MSDFGPSLPPPAPDDRRASPRPSQRTDGEILYEGWNLSPVRWLWLLVINVCAFALMEGSRSSDSDSLLALGQRAALWALSLPIGWAGLLHSYKDCQPMFVLNAPLWALMVELLIARCIAVRHDPEEECWAEDATANSSGLWR